MPQLAAERPRKPRRWGNWLRGSAVAVILSFGGVVAIGGGTLIAVQCSESAAVRATAKKLLTATELASLRPADGWCSDVYVFTRDGEPRCIVAGADAVASCG